MKLQQNLTKENFWNEMMSTYPQATKLFCDWVDEYKKAVKWHRLFNWNGLCGPLPKYHDLPHAIQQGIFIEFIRQNLGDYFEQVERHMSELYDFEEDVKTVLSEIDQSMDYQNTAR